MPRYPLMPRYPQTQVPCTYRHRSFAPGGGSLNQSLEGAQSQVRCPAKPRGVGAAPLQRWDSCKGTQGERVQLPGLWASERWPTSMLATERAYPLWFFLNRALWRLQPCASGALAAQVGWAERLPACLLLPSLLPATPSQPSGSSTGTAPRSGCFWILTRASAATHFKSQRWWRRAWMHRDGKGGRGPKPTPAPLPAHSLTREVNCRKSSTNLTLLPASYYRRDDRLESWITASSGRV